MSLQTVVEDCLRGLGYELVELDWQAGGHLRVFIEHSIGSGRDAGSGEPVVESEGPVPEDGSGIRIEDCERVSHQLSHVLMVEDIDYSRLEVSSPGLDRLLRRQVDFERFMGSPVSIKLKYAVGGRRNFEGTLLAGEGGRFALDVSPPEKPGPGGKRGKAPKAGKAVSRPVDSGEAAAAQPQRVLFSLDEVERARLVPRLKF